jgi:hypothetical protein
MILAGMIFIWLTLATLHAVAVCWAVVSPSSKPLRPYIAGNPARISSSGRM